MAEPLPQTNQQLLLVQIKTLQLDADLPLEVEQCMPLLLAGTHDPVFCHTSFLGQIEILLTTPRFALSQFQNGSDTGGIKDLPNSATVNINFWCFFQGFINAVSHGGRINF